MQGTAIDKIKLRGYTGSAVHLVDSGMVCDVSYLAQYRT